VAESDANSINTGVQRYWRYWSFTWADLIWK